MCVRMVDTNGWVTRMGGLLRRKGRNQPPMLVSAFRSIWCLVWNLIRVWVPRHKVARPNDLPKCQFDDRYDLKWYFWSLSTKSQRDPNLQMLFSKFRCRLKIHIHLPFVTKYLYSFVVNVFFWLRRLLMIYCSFSLFIVISTPSQYVQLVGQISVEFVGLGYCFFWCSLKIL